MIQLRIQSTDAITEKALQECLSQYGFTCLPGGAQGEALELTDREGAVEIGDGEQLSKPLRADALAQALHRAAAPAEPPALGNGWQVVADERVLKHENGQTLALTEKECALLLCLLSQPAHTASRQELLEKVWGYGQDVATRTLETHMHRLRAKLKEATGGDGLLMTTETGYRLAL